jgi:hypothetical protein
VPKVSVYLPDDLYRRAREHDLALSALTQDAVARALAAQDNRAWIDRVGAQPPRVREPVDIGRLMDEVRDGFAR